MAKEKVDNITPEGEAPQQEVVLDNVSAKAQAPIDENGSSIFLLSNDKRKGNVVIDFDEMVTDPTTGKPRAMRLLRKASSIWLDEQPPAQFTEKFVQKNLVYVTFNNGKLTVPNYEANILKAMELSNKNSKNPNKIGIARISFHKWNPLAEQEKEAALQNLEIEAMTYAIKAEKEKMIPHAMYLNLDTNDAQGLKLEEKGIRNLYVAFAKKEPKKFLDSKDSTNVMLSYRIRLAVESGLIDTGKSVGEAHWKDGGFIAVIPEGSQTVEYLVRFANMTNDASYAFVAQLKEMVK